MAVAGSAAQRPLFLTFRAATVAVAVAVACDVAVAVNSPLDGAASPAPETDK
jgi:hypothetical protein